MNFLTITNLAILTLVTPFSTSCTVLSEASTQFKLHQNFLEALSALLNSYKTLESGANNFKSHFDSLMRTPLDYTQHFESINSEIKILEDTIKVLPSQLQVYDESSKKLFGPLYNTSATAALPDERNLKLSKQSFAFYQQSQNALTNTRAFKEDIRNLLQNLKSAKPVSLVTLLATQGPKILSRTESVLKEIQATVQSGRELRTAASEITP